MIAPKDHRASIYNDAALDALRKRLRVDPHLFHRMRVAFFRKSDGPIDCVKEFTLAAQEAIQKEIAFHSLSLDRRLDSSQDGATKLIFRTESGFSIESIVLRAATGRIALCVSSQIGCAAKCDFCATGQMGIARNLPHNEIVDQVVQANRLLREEGRRIRNIVFMGMGEPLHNEHELRRALGILTSPCYLDHPPSRILVSTVGIVDRWIAVAEDFPLINYALSLHSAVQSVRERIIPLATRYPIDRLRDAIVQLNSIQPGKNSIMIEYLMLDGVNDREEDLEALSDWIKDLRVHLNLIPFNPIEGAPHLRCSPRRRIEEFGAAIRKTGTPTTIRYSMGGDIEAACGQLVRRENRCVATELAPDSKLPQI